MTDMTTPKPPPEAGLIESKRLDIKPRLSIRKAAERAGISDTRWRQITAGYQIVTKDNRVPVRAPAGTLASMARVVGVTEDELIGVGRADAADQLATSGHPAGAINAMVRGELAKLDVLRMRLADVSTLDLIRLIEGRFYDSEKKISSLELSVESQWTALEQHLRRQRDEAPEPQQDEGRQEGTGAGKRGTTPITSAERAKRRLQRVTSEGELLPGAALSEHGVTDGAIREIDKIARAARERHTRGVAEPVDGPDEPD